MELIQLMLCALKTTFTIISSIINNNFTERSYCLSHGHTLEAPRLLYHQLQVGADGKDGIIERHFIQRTVVTFNNLSLDTVKTNIVV